MGMKQQEKPYQSHFKYVTIKAILSRLLHVKTPEAVAWRKSARKYLKDFELQWEYRNLPSWNIDTEVFDELQRKALSIFLCNFVDKVDKTSKI